MSQTHSRVLDLSRSTVGLFREGRSDVEDNGPGPPRRVEGLIVGAPHISTDPPHDGEMHPDGDELLYVISGRFDLRLELDGEVRVVELGPGQATVVPRGIWHKVLVRSPGQLIHVTPGPGGEHRALPKGKSG